MNKKTALILSLVFVILGDISIAQETTSLRNVIEKYVEAEAEYGTFSGAVLVAREGEIIYSGAVGLENKEKNIPNKLATKFNMGSIGKTFTAILIMQLVETGQMKLSDPLEKYLPDFPHPEKSAITITHLLTHSSGLGNYFTHDGYWGVINTARNINEVLPFVYDQPLKDFIPGEQYHYSNSGMLVLGAIIEKVTGMSYKEVLEKKILEPAGMNNSGLYYYGDKVTNRAVGYTKIGENEYRAESETQFAPFSEGGILSTMEDMLQYDRALHDNILLSEKSKSLMFSMTGPDKNYALGWEIGVYEGEHFVGHVGGTYGFMADFIRFPEKQIMIIVASNCIIESSYNKAGIILPAKIKALVFKEGKTNIPLATQYDYNFQKGRYLSEVEKDYQASIELLDKNIRGPNPHLPSLFLAARSRIFGNIEVEKAIELLQQYMKLNPEASNSTQAAVWWLSGKGYEQLNDPEKAIDCYKKNLKVNPEFNRAKESLNQLTGEK